MLSNERVKYTDKEILEFGYSGFLRFIRHSKGISKEDYLKLEKEIFKGISVDEIYDNAKEYWENKD